MSTADKLKIVFTRYAGHFVFPQPLFCNRDWPGFVDIENGDSSVSETSISVSSPSHLIPDQPCHLHMYPISRRVPIQTENAAPARTQPFRSESSIDYEVKNSHGKKQKNIADYMDFKGYWVAITCR